MPGVDAARSDRLNRERTFHDGRFAGEDRQAAGKYYAVDTGRARYDQLVGEAAVRGSVVLEYGCGTGSQAFGLARTGAQVVGIDISGVGVAKASSQASRDGLTASFAQMDAEHLATAPATFDVVCGSGILHHLDIDRSLEEIQRALKPGGVALFYEPLGSNPFINLYRRLTPSMRTPDEHPLGPKDFALMRRKFCKVEVEHHTLLSLAGVVLVKVPMMGGVFVRALQRADRLLLHSFAFAQRFAWVAVIRMHR